MTVALPLWFISGLLLFAFYQSPKAPKGLTVLTAIVFGASTANTVFAVIQAAQSAFSKA